MGRYDFECDVRSSWVPGKPLTHQKSWVAFPASCHRAGPCNKKPRPASCLRARRLLQWQNLNGFWVFPVILSSPALVSTSQSGTVWSSEAEASLFPSGEKATTTSQPEWPSSVLRDAPITASESRTVQLSEAEASCLPSGENVTALTQSEWPSSLPRDAPVAASQSRTMSSQEAEASCLPLGEKSTATAQNEWCSKFPVTLPSPRSRAGTFDYQKSRPAACRRREG